MKTESVVMSIDGSSEQTIPLPQVFQTPFRPEVIHRVYVNLLSHRYQRQGRYPAAGEIVSAESRNTGLGIARLARIRGQGFSRSGQAAGVASVRAGRVAHPPESWKLIRKKINKKERRLGLSSAIAATARKDLIQRRGHIIEGISSFPIICSDDIESITKTHELLKTLVAFGLANDLSRARRPKKRRKSTAHKESGTFHAAKSALIIVKKGAKVVRLSKSIPGVDVRTTDSVSVLDLAPGSKPIRLTIFSRGSLDYLKRSTVRSKYNPENESRR
jgi:large subunit ribosomal protein L4e